MTAAPQLVQPSMGCLHPHFAPMCTFKMHFNDLSLEQGQTDTELLALSELLSLCLARLLRLINGIQIN